MLTNNILQALNDSNTKFLNLRAQGITNDDLIQIAQYLPNSNIVTLLLGGNYSIKNSSGVIAIANAIEQGSKIKTLELSNARIGDSGVINIARVIQNSKIKKLDLSGTNMSDEGLVVLAQHLKNSNVKYLDISSNLAISYEGMNTLATALQDSQITSLHFKRISELYDPNDILYNCLARYPYMTEITTRFNDQLINSYIARNKEVLDCAQQVIRHLKDINLISPQDIRVLNKQYYQAFEIFYKIGKINLVWESDNELIRQDNKELICNKIQQAITYYYPQITHIVSGEHMERDMPRNVSLADLESSGLLGEVFQYCDIADVHY